MADDDTKVKYSSVLPDTADQIYSNFKTVLKEECDRPLFVAVYTELWIYKDGRFYSLYIYDVSGR